MNIKISSFDFVDLNATKNEEQIGSNKLSLQ